MIYSSHPQQTISPKLINFLKQKIQLSENAIKLGIKHSQIEQAPLPIVLWSFGLLTLEQYQKVLNWENDQS